MRIRIPNDTAQLLGEAELRFDTDAYFRARVDIAVSVVTSILGPAMTANEVRQP